MTVQVICDFDGTIAEKDMIATIMREFVPGASKPLIEAVQAGELSVRDGVEAMFRLIPSKQYDAVAAFARANTVVRPGFQQFIHSCAQLGWRVAIVSGGFDFFVHPVIHKISTPVDIYCNRLDTTGPVLEVVWQVPCDEHCDPKGCGLCKPSVMRWLAKGATEMKFVVIGDGVTDFKAAQQADFVYARAQLLDLVKARGIPYAAFDTFHDIERDILDGGASIHAFL